MEVTNEAPNEEDVIHNESDGDKSLEDSVIAERHDWTAVLRQLLGYEGADYFLNPVPVERKVRVNPIMYSTRDLQEAWGQLRKEADERIRLRQKTRSKSSSGSFGSNDELELDKSYFSFAVEMLIRTGHQFQARMWSDEKAYYNLLKRLSDDSKSLSTSRRAQEAGVSFRAATMNRERCQQMAASRPLLFALMERMCDSEGVLGNIVGVDAILNEVEGSVLERERTELTRRKEEYIKEALECAMRKCIFLADEPAVPTRTILGRKDITIRDASAKAVLNPERSATLQASTKTSPSKQKSKGDLYEPLDYAASAEFHQTLIPKSTVGKDVWKTQGDSRSKLTGGNLIQKKKR